MRGPKPKKGTPRKARPLRAFVERGVLVIEIGIDTLAHATLHSEYVDTLARDLPGPGDAHFDITNAAEFADDVVHELVAEAEDGSSLITKLIDDATTSAIDQGSIAFVDKERAA